MSDHFTELFTDNPRAFAVLHDGLTRDGYVTDADEPHMNRPGHNSLTEERYKRVFKKHNPGQGTEIEAAACAFDIGDGFPSFYVVYDQKQFEDREDLERELKRIGVLK